MPIFTVNPRFSQISSLILSAIDTGLSVPVMSRYASSIDTCSTAKAYFLSISMNLAEYSLYVLKSDGKRQSFGHFSRARITGSPVLTPCFLAGIEQAVITPCLFDTSPPIAEGIVLRSTLSGSSLSFLTAVQERKAEFTSTWKISLSIYSSPPKAAFSSDTYC